MIRSKNAYQKMSLAITAKKIDIGSRSRVAVMLAPRHSLNSSEAPLMRAKIADMVVARNEVRSLRKRKAQAFWTLLPTI